MQIIKRNGRIVEFDKTKIASAIANAMRETLQGVDTKLCNAIADTIFDIYEGCKTIPIEEIQDMVETLLMESPRKDAAKRYIIYRVERDNTRKHRKTSDYKLLTDDFVSDYKHKEPPMDELGMFTYYRTYSRWLEDEGRRENWWETCRRAIEYNCSLVNTTKKEAQQLYDNMFNLKQFVSARTLWIGQTEVSKKFPMSNFNCSSMVVDNIQAFVDLFYLLMLGAGVGIRVLPSDVKKLPKFKTDLSLIHQDYTPAPKKQRLENSSLNFISNDTAEIIVGDSKNAWRTSLHFFLMLCSDKSYEDINKIIINYNYVRPYGEKLKTFGGFASGHTAIKNIFDKINSILRQYHNLKYAALTPLNVIDICNCISLCVVVGGVRRSAQASLISQYDTESIQAKNNLYVYKDGKWIENEELAHRKMSNNSILYEKKPTREQLNWHLEQLKKNGEPGFVNKQAALTKYDRFEGCNPCFEVLLPDRGVCNLTTINVAAFCNDGNLDLQGLVAAQRLSTRAAYRMSTVELELPHWDVVNKEEKILGVSFTGWQSAIGMLNYNEEQEKELLLTLWETAFAASEEIANELNMDMPIQITNIKPSGTLSLLPNVSDGVHYPHAPYYIRRVRINAHDPLVKVCEDLGYPVFNEVGEEDHNCRTKVIEFPCKSLAKKTKYQATAIEQLENYKRFMEYYADGNVSITVTVKDEEWEGVEQWLYENWDGVVAISFLSLTDSYYDLMPYEEISEIEYEERKRNMRPFIPSLLSKYEKQEIELDVGGLSECEGGVCSVR